MTKIFHNPRCSKSREAVELLRSRDIEFQEVRYLDDPPSAKELKQVVKMLGIKPADLVRRKEKLFKELQLEDQKLSDKKWIEIMVENPKLIERPIVIHNEHAAIGRPIEKIVELLDSDG
ncbi:arsenate reductase (glutaredoxin) [Stieleria sp. JC731]|uniref:arsenate reductase (glutaredoxin) n=1 Tax=Pirellulaceae TaxID=2691357 RepID=UPI001E4CD918|nr:arsenate reductase (glutaredoxin) [Stieleria sp. JC731]MCC9603302.1 arsenate reductase (glutaredoxin) [Stieleria sp. JC731]